MWGWAGRQALPQEGSCAQGGRAGPQPGLCPCSAVQPWQVTAPQTPPHFLESGGDIKRGAHRPGLAQPCWPRVRRQEGKEDIHGYSRRNHSGFGSETSGLSFPLAGCTSTGCPPTRGTSTGANTLCPRGQGPPGSAPRVWPLLRFPTESPTGATAQRPRLPHWDCRVAAGARS